jgi:hypothetical protein
MPKAKAQSSLLSFFEEKENRNPNAAPVSRHRQAVASPALQPVNNDVVDLTGVDDEEMNPALHQRQAVAAPALQQRQAVAAPDDVINVDSDLEDDAPLACKKAKVVVDDSQVGSEEHGTFKLQTLFLWSVRCLSLNLLTSHVINDCLGQLRWETTSWARMAVAILMPSALPNSKENWILSTLTTDSR